MRKIHEIQPFEDPFELFEMPAVRIIGKEARCGGKLGNTAPKLAEETLKSDSWNQLKHLPLILKDSLGLTCDHDEETNTFSYLVAVMTQENTEVPEGFTYRDLPATVCAKGRFGESISKTIKRAEELGYTTNWGPYPWNAEIYIKEECAQPPKKNCEPNHWLVPVILDK